LNKTPPELRHQGDEVVTLQVLVCDELPIVRDGIRTLLDADPEIEVVETTDSGIHAIILVRTLKPDVVVTGLNLHALSGLELIRRLGKEAVTPKPRVVVFTMSDSDEVVTSVLRAGANGLLVKEATREELSSAIHAAARGQTMLAPQVTHRLVDWFRRADAHSDELLRPVLAELTPRERQVLLLMADGMTTDEVAGELAIGLTTVRTHVYRLRTKLKARDRAQLVSFAYRAGLMSPPDGRGLDGHGDAEAVPNRAAVSIADSRFVRNGAAQPARLALNRFGAAVPAHNPAALSMKVHPVTASRARLQPN
jgi:DNA-binding NarL/FixJ family response regulator